MTDRIRREDGAGGGRYVAESPGGSQAELTYRRSGATLVLDHTFVPPAFRGQGMAHRLVARAVADAREAGERLRPVCSYAAADFARHPDWDDVLAP